MIWLWIILGFIVLVVLGALVPEHKYHCELCKDSGYIEVNIWYDEVTDVDCPKCKGENMRAKKIMKIKRLLKK
jgi:Zn finger protein HypA/HybF involved in hydrogenase expression